MKLACESRVFLKRHTFQPYLITLPIKSEHAAKYIRLQFPHEPYSTRAEKSLVLAKRCADRTCVGPAAKQNLETDRSTGSHVSCFGFPEPGGGNTGNKRPYMAPGVAPVEQGIL